MQLRLCAQNYNLAFLEKLITGILILYYQTIPDVFFIGCYTISFYIDFEWRSPLQKMLIKAFAKEVIDEFSLSSVQDISEIALDSWING